MSSYLKKGGIAIVDQVLFSGSNFLLNIFLVKLLTPSDYGLFGSLYSLYILTCIGFIAIFLEPYIYYKNTLGDTQQYTTLHAGFANALLLLSLVLTCVGCMTHEYLYIYISYTFTTCIIYFYKRHYLAVLSPKYSLYISISYFLLVTVGLLCLNYAIPKNLFNAFLVLNIACVLSVVPMFFINNQFKTLLYRTEDVRTFASILKRQKKYSFHCFTSGVLSWVPNNIYFIILPFLYSNEINAHFKALQNTILPISHLNIAIVSLLVPIFIKSLHPEKLIRQISLLFTIFPLMYLVIILLSLSIIKHYIYDDKYDLQPLLVVSIVVGVIPEIIANIYKAFFRSINKSEVVTKINMINALFSLVCVYFVYHFGLTGAIISYVIINVFNLINSTYLFNCEIRLQKRVFMKLIL